MQVWKVSWGTKSSPLSISHFFFSWNLLVSKTLPDFQENPPTRWQGVIHSGKEDSGFSQTFLSAIYLLVLVWSFFSLLELLVITWIDSNELHRPEGIRYQSEVQLSVQSVQKHKFDQLSFDYCVYEHWFSWVISYFHLCNQDENQVCFFWCPENSDMWTGLISTHGRCWYSLGRECAASDFLNFNDTVYRALIL